MCSKHVEAWNKVIVKQKVCTSSWLITEINKLGKICTTYVLSGELGAVITIINTIQDSCVVTYPTPSQVTYNTTGIMHLKIYRCFRIITKSHICLSVCPSLRPPVWNKSAPTGGIFMKSDTWFFLKYVEKYQWARHVARMGEEREVYRVLVGEQEGRRPLGRPRRRWVDNIRMDVQEVGCGYMDWIGLAQDRDSWRTLVSAIMNLRVPWNAGNFLTSCKPVSFARRTLRHGVSKYQVSWKSDKNKGYFTCWSMYIFDHIPLSSS